MCLAIPGTEYNQCRKMGGWGRRGKECGLNWGLTQKRRGEEKTSGTGARKTPNGPVDTDAKGVPTR